MSSQTISIGNDHAGFAAREVIERVLREKGVEIIDHGTQNEDSTDYPDHIHPVADDVQEGKADLGIIACGSGNGAAMTANKHAGIRAALCWTPELASLARQHNDANILSLPTRFLSEKELEEIVIAFLTSEFEGGRHARRVGKIDIDANS